MDKLENFIVNHKNELGAERNPEQGWNELNRRLDNSEKTNDRMIYWKVAAIVFLISTVVLSVFQINDNSGVVSVASNMDKPDIESFYVQQISLKMQEYMGLADGNEMEELMLDLEDMDLAYSELKESFNEFGNDEMADAMMENLRLRIFILNEQIQLIRNGKSGEESFHSS